MLIKSPPSKYTSDFCNISVSGICSARVHGEIRDFYKEQNGEAKYESSLPTMPRKSMNMRWLTD